MSEKIKRIEVAIGVDEVGDTEELTWDLIPIVDAEQTKHLDEIGLPKPGTMLRPGMIMVGKIGKTKAYIAGRKPTDLELHSLGFGELQRQFAYLWNDCSERVPAAFYGVVVESRLETRDDGTNIAVVLVRPA